jgi:hypothetical protein
MRTLNKKQKTFITKWFNENWKGAGSIYTIDQMPIEMQKKLEQMNDHETIWQNADRLISDLACQNVHNNSNRQPWDR